MSAVGPSSPLRCPPTAVPPPSLSPPPICPELDLSLPLGHSTTHTPTHPAPPHKPRPHGPTGHVKPTYPKAQTHRQQHQHTHRQVHFEEPVVVTVTAEPSNLLSNNPALQQSIKGHKKRGRIHGRPRTQQLCPAAATANEEAVGFLEGAGLNTTLMLRAELEALQGAEFNSQKAVQQTLQQSVRTKNLINSRVTGGVNVPPTQLLYSSLVSIGVQEDQLISQKLQDRLQLAPPPRSHGDKPSVSSVRLLLSSELREKPVLQGEGPVLQGEGPCRKTRPLATPRPAHFTFDLHRRHLRWQP